MKIAVNTRLLLKNKLEGIGWVAYETLKRMVLAHPEVEFYFIFDRQPDEMFLFAKNVKPVVLFPQARHPFLYVWFFEISMARALKKIKPDLFYSPDGYMCLRTNVPTVVHFHDLNFEHFPKDMPALALWHYKTFFPRYARKARRIVTVSQFSKNDICECYHIDPSKIDVAYNGANELFVPIAEEEKQVVKDKYTGGKPYFMFVGSLHPRKNLARLFAAYDLYKCKTGDDTQLVIVGEKRWWTKPIQQAYEKMQFKQNVFFTGHLNAQELHLVTAAAQASVYVSYFEGFGIPIIEAFRCRVPVVTSNVTAMPEVAGDAAILTNPFDEDAIANALEMSKDSQLVPKLIEKGWSRKDQFSWDMTANLVWNSLENAL